MPSDLYDADNRQNKVKVISLTAAKPDFDQTFYLCTAPMEGSELLKDVRPMNNVRPVTIVGKYILGDVNGDGLVNNADISATILHISGNTPATFNVKAADVNKDDSVDIADLTGIISIISQ